jgi:alginate O-acetyltransferase complex protein AlgI
LQILYIAGPSVDMTLKIVLPLGISFYTFEAISYVVDVYRGQVKPAKRYWDYVLFVIYFPHLIAGPIMRAKNFLPQVTHPRQIRLDQFYEGCHLFFWGLFEKIFIADNMAKIVNPVFGSPGPYQGGEVLVALYAFTFQIFCDFDGYSNMARGLGKCMGFEIAINFKLPYFATNPTEFWRRWHITLSSWLRDYLYIPLGGNRKGEFRMYLSLLVTMILGGLWHGASWTFVLWGAYHGTLLCVHKLLEKFSILRGQSIGWRIFKVAIFFHAVVLGWLLFRATSVHQAVQMLHSIFDAFHWPMFGKLFPSFFFIIAPLLFVQVAQAKWNNLMVLLSLPRVVKIAVYAFMTYLILGFGVMEAQEFVYFQF